MIYNNPSTELSRAINLLKQGNVTSNDNVKMVWLLGFPSFEFWQVLYITSVSIKLPYYKEIAVKTTW